MSDGGSANEAGASGSGRPAIPGMRGLIGRRPSAPITPGRLPSIRSRDLTLGGVKKAERHRIQTFTAIDENVAKRGLQTLDKENGRHLRPQDNVLMTNIGDVPESNWNPPTQPMSAPQIRDRTDAELETVRLKYEPKRLELVQEIASLEKQIVQCERELAFKKSKRHRELELADKLHQKKFELSNKPWQREFELTDMFWQKEVTLASTPWQEEIVPGVKPGQQNMKLNGIPWQQEHEIVHKPWQEEFELVQLWQRNVDLVNQQWQRVVQFVVKQQQNEVKLADKLQQSKLELVSQQQQQNMELVNKPLPSEHTLSNKPWQRELELVYKPSLRDYELVYKPWKEDLELFENPATSEKTFTPNIISRKIKEEPKEDLSLKKEKKDRDRDRQRDGAGRGRGRPEIIQSHSIFEQGPAEMMKKKGNWDSPMDMADLGPSHIINIKKEKRETEEETKNILRMLEKDDFIDDPGLKNDTRNTPVQLPLALSGWLFKEESDDQDWQSDSKEVKMEVDHPVKVKEEPMDADDVKDALPDLKPTVSKKVPGLLPDLSLPQLLENLNLTKEEDLLFLQLPDTLPGQPPTQDSRPVKTEVQTEDGQTMLVKQEKSQEAKLAENTCCLGDLAEGLVGKLLIRKSGKVQLVLGKVTLDVTMGTSSSFLQELVSVGLGDGRQGDMTVLGHIKHKLVCSPDFESLLENKQ